EITTGPILVVPAAALIRFFGNRYWVPNLAYTLVVWILMLIMLRLVHRSIKGGAFGACVFVVAMGLLAFTSKEFGLLGEVPAALLVAIAALQIGRVDHDTPVSTVALVGLGLGCAVITKTISALAVPAFVLWLIL